MTHNQQCASKYMNVRLDNQYVSYGILQYLKVPWCNIQNQELCRILNTAVNAIWSQIPQWIRGYRSIFNLKMSLMNQVYANTGQFDNSISFGFFSRMATFKTVFSYTIIPWVRGIFMLQMSTLLLGEPCRCLVKN